MSIHVALHHRTSYFYDRPIALGPQVVRLRPAPHCRTPILSYSLKIEPRTHFLNWQQDPFSNYLGRLVFPEKTKKFETVVEVVAEMSVYNPFDFFLESSAENYPFAYEPGVAHDLAPYLKVEPQGELFNRFVKKIDRTKRRTIDFVVDVNQMLQNEIAYLIRMEPGVQAPDDTLQKKSGSCRDSAWLMCEVLRHCGLGGALRVRVPDSIETGRKVAGWPVRRGGDFTDCMRGRRYICRARVGSDSTRHPACSPGRATFRSRAHRSRRPRLRSRGRPRRRIRNSDSR